MSCEIVPVLRAPSQVRHVIRRKRNMKQTQMIPETFLGVGYTRDRGGLPLEAVRVPVPQPAADQVLIRVAASSLNPLEYKLADLNFMGRTPPVVLGLDLAGEVVAVGHGVSGVAVGDAVAAMADLNGDGGWVATGGSGGEGGYAVARQFLTVRKPPSLSFRDAAALPMCFLSAFAGLYRAVKAGDTVYIPGGGGGVGHLAVQMAAWPLGSAVGSCLAAVMFLTTLTFLFTTPGWEPSLGGFPALSAMPGQFVLKDVVLLGVSILSAGETVEGAALRRAGKVKTAAPVSM
jgi:hypothetical protein